MWNKVIHGRWAMLGALGCITAEVLEKWVRVDLKEPVWFKAGAPSSDILRRRSWLFRGPQLCSSTEHPCIVSFPSSSNGACWGIPNQCLLGVRKGNNLYPGARYFDLLALLMILSNLPCWRRRRSRMASWLYSVSLFKPFSLGSWKGPLENLLDQLDMSLSEIVFCVKMV